MGGFGSGDWYRFDKKSTVEESLTLAMRDFRGLVHVQSAGAIGRTWANGSMSYIGFFVTWGHAPIITLNYRLRDGCDVRIVVHLQSTPTQFGGERWWFTCPLVVDGVACKRRVGKLHLPPRANYFACRKCHNLTYRSSQEAHQEERLFANADRMEQWLGTLQSRQR